jgi:hypothetical protein
MNFYIYEYRLDYSLSKYLKFWDWYLLMDILNILNLKNVYFLTRPVQVSTVVELLTQDPKLRVRIQPSPSPGANFIKLFVHN